jgi:hypothetical protein
MTEAAITPEPRTLVWLASYPKSGNTWLRAFLANYFIASDGPVSINEMQKISFGDSSAPAYAELSGRDPRRLGPAAVAALRQRHLARIAAGAPVNFVKTHNANIRLAGHPLIPARLTRAAVYLIRDPRDVVISYADHFALDLAGAARAMASPANAVPSNARTVMQFPGDWSGHVRSWTRAPGFPVLVLRYEDLLARPEAGFEQVLHLIGAPVDRSVLAQAVAHASFAALAAQEAAQGFRERGAAQARFFRPGTAGQWREALPARIAARIEAAHGAEMRRHGYLAP